VSHSIECKNTGRKSCRTVLNVPSNPSRRFAEIDLLQGIHAKRTQEQLCTISSLITAIVRDSFKNIASKKIISRMSTLPCRAPAAVRQSDDFSVAKASTMLSSSHHALSGGVAFCLLAAGAASDVSSSALLGSDRVPPGAGWVSSSSISSIPS